jgi:hypothetical protein
MPKGSILRVMGVVPKVMAKLGQSLLPFSRRFDELSDMRIDFFQLAFPDQIFPIFSDYGQFSWFQDFWATCR